MPQYKNIIFDLGGVLIDIDYQAPINAFEKAGIRGAADMYSQTGVNELFGRLETGDISNTDFYQTLRSHSTLPVTDRQLETAWNSILGSWRKSSLAYLSVLKKHYQIYLLSNTNDIHYQCFQQSLQKEAGYRHLDDFFTKAWYSHLIRHRKPDAGCYEFVLKDGGLAKEETLFIDDSAVNITGALTAGLPARLLQKGERIENIGLLQW